MTFVPEIKICYYLNGVSTRLEQTAVDWNNAAVTQLVVSGDWVAAQREWEAVLSLLVGGGAAYDIPASSGLPDNTTSYLRSILDEGLDTLDTTGHVIELQRWASEGAADGLNAHDLCPSLATTIVLFNLACAKSRLDELDAATFYYQQALESMLQATNLGEMVKHGIQSKTQWLIRTVAIPALYTLGRIACRMQHWTTAAAYMNLALTHAVNLTMADSMSSSTTSSDALHSPTPSSLGMLRHVGAILNALGVIHSSTSRLCPDASTTAREHASLARFFYEQALPIVTQGWGTESSVLATTLHNLGRILMQCHDATTGRDAVGHLERAVQIRHATLEAESLDTVSSLVYLALALYQAGDTSMAMETVNRCLAHPSLQTTKYNNDVVSMLMEIATIYRQEQNVASAEQLYHRCLTLTQAEFGEHHLTSATVWHQLATLYFDVQLYDSALQTFHQSLAVLRIVQEPSHPNVIATLFLLGEVYRKQHKLDSALMLYKEAIELQRLHRERNIPLAVALHSMGLLHDDLGEPHLALECLQESIHIRESIQGFDHVDLVDVTIDVGELLFQQDMIVHGLEAYTEAWRICTLCLGRNHFQVADTLLCIGECHTRLGNLISAMACLTESLRIQRLHDNGSSDNRPLVLMATLQALGGAHKSDGNSSASIEFFRQALDVEQLMGTVDPTSRIAILAQLGEEYLTLGQVGQLVNTISSALRSFPPRPIVEILPLTLLIRSFAPICDRVYASRPHSAPAA